MNQVENYFERVANDIKEKAPLYLKMSHQIHEKPELGNEEQFACQLLTNLLKEEGFEVEIDIATHPTGFIARKKSQKEGPSIGILVEYDALRGLGHACGHNIIAMMSIGASLAISSVLDELGGKVVVYGTPAEEGGPHGNAKESYVQEHLFDEVDVCMMIHPFHTTAPTQPTLAIVKPEFKFFGRPSHAGAAPEKGINALDAMLLFYSGINAMRQQMPPRVLIHGIITNGGEAPNIIPAYTKASFYIRAPKSDLCDIYKEKILKIGQGAALATGCRFKYDDSLNRVREMFIIPSFENLFIEEANRLGLEVKTKDCKSIGSTDAGNVSQVVPTIHPTIKICNDSITIHTEEFKQAAKSEAGDQAIIDGAIILARIAVRLLTDDDCLKMIKEEFQKIKEAHLSEVIEERG